MNHLHHVPPGSGNHSAFHTGGEARLTTSGECGPFGWSNPSACARSVCSTRISAVVCLLERPPSGSTAGRRTHARPLPRSRPSQSLAPSVPTEMRAAHRGDRCAAVVRSAPSHEPTSTRTSPRGHRRRRVPAGSASSLHATARRARPGTVSTILRHAGPAPRRSDARVCAGPQKRLDELAIASVSSPYRRS